MLIVVNKTTKFCRGRHHRLCTVESKPYGGWGQVVTEEAGGEEDEHMHIDPLTLEAEICGMVAGYVGADVDVSLPLAIQGLDSLAAMELRQKLQVSQAMLSQTVLLCPCVGCSCPPSSRGHTLHCNRSAAVIKILQCGIEHCKREEVVPPQQLMSRGRERSGS